MRNRLYYGDNLEILKNYISDASVDLIYLDPPFNSKADYNLLYKEPTGTLSQAQITAFEDTWRWTEEAEKTYKQVVEEAPSDVVELMLSFRRFLKHSDVMAYLTMMCIRLIELKRVLKNTGSIYLHCDPSASHYLKILMDAIYGKRNYLNEVTWCYKSRPLSKRYFCKKHDTIFLYSKSDKYFFDWKANIQPLSPVTVKKYKYKDDIGHYRLVGRGIKGSPIQSAKDVDPEWEIKHPELVVRDYLKEGYPLEDYWHIDIINQSAKERLGYPTQKPEKLLERIIKASSSEGSVILDPFCGCGTSIAVAQRLNRQWVGIDITHLAINLIKLRLKRMFEIEPDKSYDVIGEPKDIAGANELALQDRFQFQYWALSLIDARPYGDKKKGPDTGIDGYIYFWDSRDEIRKVIVQVKSGKVGVKEIRELNSVVEREEAAVGVFLTLKEPTRPMVSEAAGFGFHRSEVLRKDYSKIQILTVEDAIAGKKPNLPSEFLISPFKNAGFKSSSKQNKIFD